MAADMKPVALADRICSVATYLKEEYCAQFIILRLRATTNDKGD